MIIQRQLVPKIICCAHRHLLVQHFNDDAKKNERDIEFDSITETTWHEQVLRNLSISDQPGC